MKHSVFYVYFIAFKVDERGEVLEKNNMKLCSASTEYFPHIEGTAHKDTFYEYLSGIKGFKPLLTYIGTPSHTLLHGVL